MKVCIKESVILVPGFFVVSKVCCRSFLFLCHFVPVPVFTYQIIEFKIVVPCPLCISHYQGVILGATVEFPPITIGVIHPIFPFVLGDWIQALQRSRGLLRIQRQCRAKLSLLWHASGRVVRCRYEARRSFCAWRPAVPRWTSEWRHQRRSFRRRIHRDCRMR